MARTKRSRPSAPRPPRPREAFWREPSARQAPSRSRSATAKSKKSGPIHAAQIRAPLRVKWRSAEPCASRVTGAARKVVVDHAGRLHEGVDDRRPAKLEAA